MLSEPKDRLYYETPTFRILVDKHNWTLQTRNSKGNFSTEGFYGTLENLLTGFADRKIKDAKLDGIKEILAEIKQIAKTLKGIKRTQVGIKTEGEPK